MKILLALNLLATLTLGWVVMDTRSDVGQVMYAWDGLASAVVRITCITRVDGILDLNKCPEL